MSPKVTKRKRRLFTPEFNAAACEAANASWLDGPATKVSNV